LIFELLEIVHAYVKPLLILEVKEILVDAPEQID
jgi:hypothetical protein